MCIKLSTKCELREEKINIFLAPWVRLLKFRGAVDTPKNMPRGPICITTPNSVSLSQTVLEVIQLKGSVKEPNKFHNYETENHS